MADPYRAYHDDDDDDEEENMDPAVAETIDAKTLEKGIQMSLQVSTLSQAVAHSSPYALRYFSSLTT